VDDDDILSKYHINLTSTTKCKLLRKFLVNTAQWPLVYAAGSVCWKNNFEYETIHRVSKHETKLDQLQVPVIQKKVIFVFESAH
jgi:hypothetical protein